MATDISADGQVIVGGSNNNISQGQQAFRLTTAEGMVGLGFLPGTNASMAYRVSSDGLAMVGHSSYFSGNTKLSGEACRWKDGVIEGLGQPPGGSCSVARATSDGGSVVVGYCRVGSELAAVIWDEANGMRSLKTVLEGYGVDVTGWSLSYAYGVSDDGLTIVGYGINPEGHTEGWIATLP